MTRILKSTSLPQQQGVVLIEALVSILIFSVGVLAIIALLTVSIMNSRDATNRATAGLLANQIIGQMWADDHNPTSLQTNYDTTKGTECAKTGTYCNNWLSQVNSNLPGVGLTGNSPTIAVSSVSLTAVPGSLVTVTIKWKPPDAAAAASPHKYTTVTQIN